MNTTISLELLMLNDLFNNHVIDRQLYEEAVKKITAGINTNNEQNLRETA